MRHRLAILLVLALAGCPHQLTQDAMQGVGAETSQASLAKLVGSDKVQDAIRRLGEALGKGALRGLNDDQQQALLQAHIKDLVSALSEEVETNLQRKISPALQEELEKNIEAAIRGLATPESRRNTSIFAKTVAQTIVRSLRKELPPALVDSIGPALQTVVEQNVGTGFRYALEEEIGPGLETVLTRNILPHLEGALSEQRKSLVEELDRTMNRGEDMAQKASYALGLVASIFLTAASLLYVSFRNQKREARHQREESELHEAAVLLIAGQIKEIHDRGGSLDELVRALKTTRDNDVGRYLRDLLDRHHEVKVHAAH